MNKDDRIMMTEMHGDLRFIKAKIEAIPDHENRLRSLERFRYAIPGGAFIATMATILGFRFVG